MAINNPLENMIKNSNQPTDQVVRQEIAVALNGGDDTLNKLNDIKNSIQNVSKDIEINVNTKNMVDDLIKIKSTLSEVNSITKDFRNSSEEVSNILSKVHLNPEQIGFANEYKNAIENTKNILNELNSIQMNSPKDAIDTYQQLENQMKKTLDIKNDLINLGELSSELVRKFEGETLNAVGGLDGLASKMDIVSKNSQGFSSQLKTVNSDLLSIQQQSHEIASSIITDNQKRIQSYEELIEASKKSSNEIVNSLIETDKASEQNANNLDKRNKIIQNLNSDLKSSFKEASSQSTESISSIIAKLDVLTDTKKEVKINSNLDSLNKQAKAAMENFESLSDKSSETPLMNKINNIAESAFSPIANDGNFDNVKQSIDFSKYGIDYKEIQFEVAKKIGNNIDGIIEDYNTVIKDSKTSETDKQQAENDKEHLEEVRKQISEKIDNSFKDMIEQKTDNYNKIIGTIIDKPESYTANLSVDPKNFSRMNQSANDGLNSILMLQMKQENGNLSNKDKAYFTFGQGRNINTNSLKESFKEQGNVSHYMSKNLPQMTSNLNDALQNNDIDKINEMKNELIPLIKSLKDTKGSRANLRQLDKLDEKKMSPEMKEIKSNSDKLLSAYEENLPMIVSIVESMKANGIELDQDTMNDLKDITAEAGETVADNNQQSGTDVISKIWGAVKQVGSFAEKAAGAFAATSVLYNMYKDPYSIWGEAGINGMSLNDQKSKARDYNTAQHEIYFDISKANIGAGFGNSQENLDNMVSKSSELYQMSGGKIGYSDYSKNYASTVNTVGVKNSGDAENLAEYSTLLSATTNLSTSDISSGMTTFYRDMNMSAEESIQMFDKITTKAQLSKIPVAEYAKTIQSLAESYRGVGMDGKDALNVMGNLMDNGFNYKDASGFASSMPGALQKFSNDSGRVILSGLMTGATDPFEMLWNSQNTESGHWSEDMAKGIDTMLGMQTSLFGNGALGKYQVSQQMQQFGFSQRQASQYINAQEKGDNVTMESILKDVQEGGNDPSEIQKNLTDKTKELSDQLGPVQEAIMALNANAEKLAPNVDDLAKILNEHLNNNLDSTNWQYNQQMDITKAGLDTTAGKIFLDHPSAVENAKSTKDVASDGVSTVVGVAGAALAAAKFAKDGIKAATNLFGKKAAETGAKEVAEKAAETGVKEVAENVAETGAKEVAENAAKTGTEVVAENAAKTGTEVVAENAVKTGAEKVTEDVVKTGAEEVAKNAAKTGMQYGAKIIGNVAGGAIDAIFVGRDEYKKWEEAKDNGYSQEELDEQEKKSKIKTTSSALMTTGVGLLGTALSFNPIVGGILASGASALTRKYVDLAMGDTQIEADKKILAGETPTTSIFASSPKVRSSVSQSDKTPQELYNINKKNVEALLQTKDGTELLNKSNMSLEDAMSGADKTIQKLSESGLKINNINAIADAISSKVGSTNGSNSTPNSSSGTDSSGETAQNPEVAAKLKKLIEDNNITSLSELENVLAEKEIDINSIYGNNSKVGTSLTEKEADDLLNKLTAGQGLTLTVNSKAATGLAKYAKKPAVALDKVAKKPTNELDYLKNFHDLEAQQNSNILNLVDKTTGKPITIMPNNFETNVKNNSLQPFQNNATNTNITTLDNIVDLETYKNSLNSLKNFHDLEHNQTDDYSHQEYRMFSTGDGDAAKYFLRAFNKDTGETHEVEYNKDEMKKWLETYAKSSNISSVSKFDGTDILLQIKDELAQQTPQIEGIKNNTDPKPDTNSTGYLGTGQLLLNAQSMGQSSYFNGNTSSSTDYKALAASIEAVGGNIGAQYDPMGLSIGMRQNVGTTGDYGDKISSLEALGSRGAMAVASNNININITGGDAYSKVVANVVKKSLDNSGLTYIAQEASI